MISFIYFNNHGDGHTHFGAFYLPPLGKLEGYAFTHACSSVSLSICQSVFKISQVILTDFYGIKKKGAT